MYKNIYYFRHINSLGGIETFFFELAKKYENRDLTIFYKTGDEAQIRRLKKYVRVKKYTNQIIECEKAFFNYNTEIIDNVKAKEYILVVHGNYHMIKDKPPMNSKINRVIAVSKDSANAYAELTGMSCEVCYNPLTIDKPQKVVRIVVASRLKDKVKGATRITKLIEALDTYSTLNNKCYQLMAFCDDKQEISNNVVYLKSRLDIRNYLADADYVCQLSDNVEGFNYTVNESLMLGTPIIYTPCDVYKEIGINETMGIKLDFDLSNLDTVVKNIFDKVGTFKFKYESPKDRWDEIFALGDSTYKEEMKMSCKVKSIIQYFDLELKRRIYPGEEYIVSRERAEYLEEKNAVKILEIIEDKPKKTAKKKEK